MASNPPTGPAALAVLADQPRVRSFLEAAVIEDRVSHAYLFLGPPGSGKVEAAYALAQCIICPAHGDATCDECIRVSHRTHPDVRYLAPESVKGYLVGQIRELLDDVPLAPIRAAAKVYIVDRAELLRDAAANALLKTIEEPPEGVTFILLARSVDACLPTIVSRCQQVPFRVVPPEAALRSVVAKTGVDEADARIALAVAGSPTRAAEYLRSDDRRHARHIVVRTLGELPDDDAYDVLLAAREIVACAHAPLESMRTQQEDELDTTRDYLTTGAVKQVEQANKRALTARERSGIMETLAVAESVLRDVLITSEGVAEPIVNADQQELIARLAAIAGRTGALRALEAVACARANLARNVSPQLAIEAMLFSAKEALTCPPSSR